MASQRSPLCAGIFASFLLSLHVPAVAHRLAQHFDAITELHPDGHVVADNNKSRSNVLNHHDVSGVAFGIDGTFGHQALSAVGAKPVSNSSLAMLSESRTKRKDNLTIAPIGVIAAVHRMAKRISRHRKQISSDLSNVAGGGSGALSVAGVAVPATAAVSCTVVASLGAFYGAVNATVDLYTNKKNKIAMKKCETVHKGLTITLALTGLVGTATALAIPAAALGMAFLGTAASAASIGNRHMLLQAICNALERNLTSDIKEAGSLDEGLNKFKDEEHDFTGTEVITEDDTANMSLANIHEAVSQAEIVPLEEIAGLEKQDDPYKELELLLGADVTTAADSAAMNHEDTDKMLNELERLLGVDKITEDDTADVTTDDDTDDDTADVTPADVDEAVGQAETVPLVEDAVAEGSDSEEQDNVYKQLEDLLGEGENRG